MNGLTSEQLFLLSLSRLVWTRREAAKASGLAFNEETITETILLDVKTAYPGHVHIIAFNKAQEAKTGADWLWSFVSADGSQSQTMLVQAKRLEDAEQLYPGINRMIGRRSPPVRQIDQLLATARSLSVPAIYAFYNHVTNVARVPAKCQSLHPGDPGYVDGFGISLAEATSVLSALPDETFDIHCSHSIPLHCLLCSGGSGKRLNGGTPEMAASALAALMQRDVRSESDPDNLGLLQGLHPMVEIALSVAARRADGGYDPFLEVHPEIAGVVVFRDAEEEG